MFSIPRPPPGRNLDALAAFAVGVLAAGGALAGCSSDSGLDAIDAIGAIDGPRADLRMAGLDLPASPADLSTVDGPLDGALALVDGMGPDLFNLDALPSGVAQGPCHGCAWHRGRAFCWGSNHFGQLGDDTRDGRSTAMPVLGLSGVVAMSVGCSNANFNGHTCAVTASGDLYCWGANGSGQLGDQSGQDQLMPVRVRMLPAMASVSLGAVHSCALSRGSRVYCWGNNLSLQLGDGSGANQPLPVQPDGLGDVLEVAAGAFHTCARLPSRSLVCWGPNTYGEIGNDSQFGAPRPTPVLDIDDAEQLVAGGFHNCARRASGTAMCWGNGEFGTLGNGTQGVTAAAQRTPVPVSLSFAPVELAATSATCARATGGSVSCWGIAYDSTGKSLIQPSPVPVTPLADAQSLGGSCATRPLATVSCWGTNNLGQVGDGTMMSRQSPQGVLGLSW